MSWLGSMSQDRLVLTGSEASFCPLNGMCAADGYSVANRRTALSEGANR